MAQTTIIINQSNVETIQPTSTCNEFAREVEGIRIGFKFHGSAHLPQAAEGVPPHGTMGRPSRDAGEYRYGCTGDGLRPLHILILLVGCAEKFFKLYSNYSSKRQ